MTFGQKLGSPHRQQRRRTSRPPPSSSPNAARSTIVTPRKMLEAGQGQRQPNTAAGHCSLRDAPSLWHCRLPCNVLAVRHLTRTCTLPDLIGLHPLSSSSSVNATTLTRRRARMNPQVIFLNIRCDASSLRVIFRHRRGGRIPRPAPSPTIHHQLTTTMKTFGGNIHFCAAQCILSAASRCILTCCTAVSLTSPWMDPLE